MPLFLAFPALTGRVLGRHSVWRKEGILPPAPPRLVRPCFTIVADSSVKQGASRIRRDRARPTGGAQPLSSPLSGVSGVAFATNLLCASEGRRSPLRHGRPSGNARGRRARPDTDPMCLPPPPHAPPNP